VTDANVRVLTILKLKYVAKLAMVYDLIAICNLKHL